MMRDVTCEMLVTRFNKAMGSPVDTKMTVDELMLRLDLIREEFKEFSTEVHSAAWRLSHSKPPDNMENLLKELADLQYVLSGFAVVFGLPLRPAFNRVHESNMSKLGDDGKPVMREDGKVMKGPNYKKPDLRDLV